MTGSGRLLIPLVFLTACFACTSPKKEEKEEKKHAVAELVGVAEEGRPLYVSCKTCHGDYGQGNQKLNAPALANTDDWYLYRQLMNFKKGLRGYLRADTLGSQMAAFAATLKDSIAISHVVAFIESMPEAPTKNTIKGDIKKGERTYQSVCGSCHGPQGKGNKAMNAPRLNGLDDWYLKRQITKFQHSVRGAHPQDIYGAQMVPMASLLKDDQSINDVIAYIRSSNESVSK
jgi:cytochrome c oxidase subunit 2